MKKLIFIILACTIIFSASAQTELGVKAGGNFSNINYDAEGASEVFNNRIGFHLGIYGIYMLSENIGIQSELLYSNEGMKYDLTGSDESGEWVFHYLQIPVLFRYQPFQNFNIHAGPQFGIKLSGRDKINQYSDKIQQLNDFSAGFAVGAGYNISEKIEFGGRYTSTITDILDDSVEPKTTSRVFQVYATFRLK